MKKLITIALGLAALCLAGCTTTSYQAGDTKFSRTAILTKNNINELSVDPKTGKVTLKGYSNEQTEVAVAVAQAVLAAVKPAVGVP